MLHRCLPQCSNGSLWRQQNELRDGHLIRVSGGCRPTDPLAPRGRPAGIFPAFAGKISTGRPTGGGGGSGGRQTPRELVLVPFFSRDPEPILYAPFLYAPVWHRNTGLSTPGLSNTVGFRTAVACTLVRYLAPLWQDIPRSAQGPRALWVWLRFVAFCISQFKSFGSSSKRAEIGPESFGIVVCRFVGTVPDILGLVWPSFRPKSGSKSKISGRILNNFRALLAQPSGLPAASGFGWSGAALESV